MDVETDLIEGLIVESIRLADEAMEKKVRAGLTADDIAEIRRMEKESDELWAKAKELGAPHVTQKNYEDLAIAIFASAARDYESLLSGSIPEGHDVSFALIEGLIPEECDIIKKTYEDRFIPYASRNAKAIAEQWKTFERQGLNMDMRVMASKYKCPLCNGSLRPIDGTSSQHIGCTGCELSVYLPSQRLKEKFNEHVQY